MTTTSTPQRQRRSRRTASRIGLAAVVTALAFTGSAGASAEIPDHTWCRYVFPGDFGGIISPYDTPPPEFISALRGEILVGTDCSQYYVVT